MNLKPRLGVIAVIGNGTIGYSIDRIRGYPIEKSPYFLCENRVVGLPEAEKSLRICLAVSTQYMNVMDGQTAGHLPMAQALFMHSIARQKWYRSCS